MEDENGSGELEKLRTEQEKQQTTDLEVQKETKKTAEWRLLLEPALAGSMLAINLGQTSLQNFYLKTACTVDLGFPNNVCSIGVGEQFRSVENRTQEIVASGNVSRFLVGSLISTIILLFVGPWSDCSGRRKPLLVIPLVGMSVMTTVVHLLLMFPGATTIQVLYAIQIPMSLGGNFALLLAAAFSYIGDVCHATGLDVTRTMGTQRAAIQVSHIIGAVGGPLLYRHLGFYGVFPIMLSLQVFSLIYVLVTVKDVNINKDNKVSVLDWRLPVNALKCLVKKRNGHRRKIILFLLVISLGDKILLSAEVLYSYLYYRNKFGWDDIIFGSFLGYKNVISFLGTLFILMVLKRFLRFSDEAVGIVSCISYILSTLGLIATHNSYIVFFLLPIIGFISQGSQVVQRPILNKQILPTEQGKIYSLMGALESATQIMTTPLHSLLYSKTLDTYPDAWLAPCVVLAVLEIISYIFARALIRRTVYEIVPRDEKCVQLNDMSIKEKKAEGGKDLNGRDGVKI